MAIASLFAEVPSVNSAEFIKFSEGFTDFYPETQLRLQPGCNQAITELKASRNSAESEPHAGRKHASPGCLKRAGSMPQARWKHASSGVQQAPNRATTVWQPRFSRGATQYI